MTFHLATALGIGPRESVAFIGAGGKSTLMLRLARELEPREGGIVMTTTTRLGLDQTDGFPAATEPEEAVAMLAAGPVFLIGGADRDKVTGVPPAMVDRMYAAGATWVLTEADGARGRSLKAPAEHEPVIPDSASLVVIVVGVDAVGATYERAAHRPPRAAALAGADVADVITAEAVARIVTDEEGGLRGVPESARVAVAITKVDPAGAAFAGQLRRLFLGSSRIERVVLVPRE